MRIVTVEREDGAVLISFTTLRGKLYRLERSDDLATWTTELDNIAGTGGIVQVVTAAAGAPRFYRALAKP